MSRASMNRSALALVALASLSTACADREENAPSSEAPAPPAYEPRVEELRALAANGPPGPDEATLAELAELIDAALAGTGDDSLARRAEARLERDEFRGHAYEAALQHEDPNVRAQCAWRLGQMGRVAALPTLFWRLRYEIDNTVRLWMCDALTQLRCHAHLDVLVELLDDARVAEPAAQLVLKVATEAGEPVPESPTWDQLKEIVRRLHAHWRRTGVAKGQEPIVMDAELEARLAGHVADLTEFQLRPVDYARLALTSLGALPLPLLRRALSAEEFYLRFHAAEVVRDIGPPAEPLGDALLPLLRDETCRVMAIEALGEIGHAAAEAPLRAALEDEDPEVRVAAAGALGPLGAFSAADDLRRVMGDATESMDVRVRAAFSLGLLEHGGEGARFLEELKARDEYHVPTLDELLARIAATGSS